MLAAMHGLGFAHLDVKPDNILHARAPRDAFKLADFGHATRLDGTQNVEDGDCKYLAAEVLAGDHRNLAAADVFSLGITLYELATGAELPAEGELYHKLRSGRALHLPTVSRPLALVIQVRACRVSARPLCAFSLRGSWSSVVLEHKLLCMRSRQELSMPVPATLRAAHVRRGCWQWSPAAGQAQRSCRIGRLPRWVQAPTPSTRRAWALCRSALTGRRERGLPARVGAAATPAPWTPSLAAPAACPATAPRRRSARQPTPSRRGARRHQRRRRCR